MRNWISCAVALTIGLMPVTVPQKAEANPGRDASNCVRTERRNGATSNADEITLRNVCDRQIFVIYCGNLPWDDRNCSGGSHSSFFTHSVNLRPGQTNGVMIRKGGRIYTGACEGTISFGNRGHFTDSQNGSYRCLAK